MLTPWKKSYDQPKQHVKKQRHYFANKGPSSQGYGFPSGQVWMWEFDYKESWVPKDWCLWNVVLEKTLESPWTAKRSNQSILKEISPGCHWKDWCWSWNFSFLDWSDLAVAVATQRSDSFEKTLMLGKTEGRGRQRMRWFVGIIEKMDVGLSGLQELVWTGRPGVLRFMGFQRVGYD